MPTLSEWAMILFGLMLAGGHDGVAAAGTVQFRDLGKPSRSRTGRVDMVNLIAPRSSVPSLLLGRKLHELQLPSDSPGGQLISSHLATLARVAHALTEDEGIAAIEATFLIAERFLGGRSILNPLQIEAVQRTIRRRAIKILDTLLPGQTPDFSDVSSLSGCHAVASTGPLSLMAACRPTSCAAA